MEREDNERLDISYTKAKAKNNVENNVLEKRLKQIDRQCRVALVKIHNTIMSEKRFAGKLKDQKKKYKHESDVDTVLIKRLQNIKTGGLAEGMRPRTTKTDVSIRKDDECDEAMSVSGRKITHEPYYVPPKMYFWSQDASTKEAVLTGFYGYRFSLQRSMTETKLLGQQAYASSSNSNNEFRREVHTADTLLRSLKPANSTAVPRLIRTVSDCRYNIDDDMLDSFIKRVPPPTREVSSMAVEQDCARMVESSTSQCEDLKNKLPKLDQNSLPSSPEALMINMRRSESTEVSHHQRAAGIASRGSLRTPTVKMKSLLPIRTREEATKELQEFLARRAKSPRMLARNKLDRSYSQNPSVMPEINRINNDSDVDPKHQSGKYTKSKFNNDMHSAVSKKVLKKGTLPAPFRKNSNTLLKHYRAPMLENKAAKVYGMAMPV